VNVATCAFDLANMAILAIQPYVEVRVDIGINMAAHKIIDMESNGVLFGFSVVVVISIGHASIVGVENLFNFFQVGSEFLVPK
jgi:hypothetical protein